MAVLFRRRPAAPSGGPAAFRAAGLALVLVLATGVCPPAAGQQQTPTQFIQEMADRVLAILRSKDMPDGQRREALRKIFLEAFDTEAIGRFALGRYWRTASEAQRARYMRLFPGYVADVYAGQFANYSGETFAAVRSADLGGSRTAVFAEIRRPNGTKIGVEFRVKKDGGRFRVIDAVVEGVSLIVTKRDEFAAVVSRRGVDGLIDRMRDLVEGRT